MYPDTRKPPLECVECGSLIYPNDDVHSTSEGHICNECYIYHEEHIDDEDEDTVEVE